MQKPTLSTNKFCARIKLKQAGFKKTSMSDAEERYYNNESVYVLFRVDNWYDITEIKYKALNPLSFNGILYELSYYLADAIIDFYIKKER